MKKSTLNITAGTDVVLNDTLTFQGEVFDPSLSVNVEANLISGLGKRSALSFEIEDTHMIIDVPWEEGRLTGCYGLEVRGVTNGRKWTTYSDSLIRYTKATEDGASSVTDDGDVYDITQTVAYRYSVSPIEEITADTDGLTGTPSVSVDYDGKDIAFHFDGIKGEKGDPFTYDDFTPEELESLRGPQGPKGNDAVVLDPEAVTIFDDMADLDGKTEEQKHEMVPTGNMVEAITEELYGTAAVTKTKTDNTAHVRIYASQFGLTAFPKGTVLTMTASNGGNLYAMYGDSRTDNNQLISLTAATENSVTVERTDITEYSVYNPGGNTFAVTMPATYGLKGDVEAVKDTLAKQQTHIGEIDAFVFDTNETLSRTIDIRSTTPRIEITPAQGGFAAGDTIDVAFADGLSSYKTTLYYFYTDNTYTNKGTYTRQVWRNLVPNAPTGKTFQKIRFVFKALTETSNPTVSVTVTRHGTLGVELEALSTRIDVANPTNVKAVILGDSYSQMNHWVNALKSYINFDEVVNLGVGGANLKDLYSYTLHPYVDRPYQGRVSANGTEYNENLINCQLEWLKRLVNGQTRGVYYELKFTTATADGTVTLDFGGGMTQTVTFSNNDSASSIAALVAALDVDGYEIVHPTGKSYVTVEAQSDEVTAMATVTASGTTVTRTKIRSAEKAIYQDGEYPDFVIVEAGKNDGADTQTEVDAYMDDVLVAQTGYVKTGSTTTSGTAYLPPVITALNRRVFSGELAYLVREIRTLFPKSLMIVVGPSSLKYGGSNLVNELKKDEQMRLACRILQIPYVSWIDDGIINRVTNYPSGSGTQADPWVLDCSTLETSDLLHPNQRGGFKLALAVAQKIRELISYRTLIKDY